MDSLICATNNAPTFETKEVWNCLQHGDICSIKFVVEPFMSMAYYKLEEERELVGYRAYFKTSEELALYSGNSVVPGASKPITTDGEFRPLITVNGQMPGPTIIARENQMLHITVYNELPNAEGISIHWHGMHQKGTPNMDGVAYITQYPILAYQSYTYKFRAFPAGTHWYHAHSGAHRTDGLYGALIVQDTIPGLYDLDLPQNHTLLLMDWQEAPSIDLFYQIRSSLSFWYNIGQKFSGTVGMDGTQIAPIPFWSGIINDKGRHFNGSGVPNKADLNTFSVRYGSRYRFRLIGAQALYAYKFSIENHKLTVIATDGNRINSITNVDYVIVNTGERYDVVVNANQEIKKYWILAETLEVNNGNRVFNNPISHHRAEAILQYEGANLFHSSSSFIPYTWSCTTLSKCRFVNCPYHPNSQADHECINVDQFSSPENVPIDNSIYNPSTTLFYNFGFDGEESTNGSSVDGINFRFPAHLPRTKEFIDDNQKCPGRGCDHVGGIKHCACTQVIDINEVEEGQSIQLVMTNRPSNNYDGNTESSHPVHLHGHTFYVVKLGYPQYNVDGTYSSPNQDVECVRHEGTGEECNQFITVNRLSAGQTTEVQSVRWTNNTPPADIDYRNPLYTKKDTVIVPYGGYAVIRFTVDNPGWWFLHCHIEIHQLEGMSAVIKELQSGNIPDEQGLIENTDVTFVLDTSGSIGETAYQYAIDFIRTIAEAMSIGQYDSRVAVILFHHGVDVYFNLNQYTDKNELTTAIRNIPYFAGGTNISAALNFLRMVAQNGSLGVSRYKRQVAIFLTDGILQGEDDIPTAADLLKETGIFELYSVGVGNANLTDLELIVSNDLDFVYYQIPFTKDTLRYFSERIIERLEGIPQNATRSEATEGGSSSSATIAIVILSCIIFVLLICLCCSWCFCFCIAKAK